jgi:hypothetical protein
MSRTWSDNDPAARARNYDVHNRLETELVNKKTAGFSPDREPRRLQNLIAGKGSKVLLCESRANR